MLSFGGGGVSRMEIINRQIMDIQRDSLLSLLLLFESVLWVGRLFMKVVDATRLQIMMMKLLMLLLS